MLLFRLSELRGAEAEVTRVKAEIAILSRAFADAEGEYLRPTIAQLRSRLGVR